MFGSAVFNILNNPENAELIMLFYILFTSTKLIKKKKNAWYSGLIGS